MFETLETRAFLSATVRFGVIGDFGTNLAPERYVANLVHGWKPNLVLTVGDNYYTDSNGPTPALAVGKYYGDYLNGRFFPTLGNHDWIDGAHAYVRYFHLPGNERYYTFRRGPVQFFAVDSDPSEPDLNYVNARMSTANSPEAQWLKHALAASTAPWKIVYFHQSPYSSGKAHGSSRWMQWPFRQWGATAVISGHDHDYERVMVGGMPFFVNGTGGNTIGNGFNTPVAGSAVRDDRHFGAMLVNASSTSIRFRFITTRGRVVDTFEIHK